MKRFTYPINGAFHGYGFVGRLYPAFFYECVPGETWNGKINCEVLSASTPEALLNRLFSDLYVFYVPNRIIWDEWTEFITQGQTGLDPGDTALPNNPPTLQVADYETVVNANFWCKQPMFVDNDSNDKSYNAMPFRAYNMIYNTYFRMPGVDSIA